MKAINTGKKIIIEADHREAAALATALLRFNHVIDDSDPLKEKLEAILQVLSNPEVKGGSAK